MGGSSPTTVWPTAVITSDELNDALCHLYTKCLFSIIKEINKLLNCLNLYLYYIISSFYINIENSKDHILCLLYMSFILIYIIWFGINRHWYVTFHSLSLQSITVLALDGLTKYNLKQQCQSIRITLIIRQRLHTLKQNHKNKDNGSSKAPTQTDILK